MSTAGAILGIVLVAIFTSDLEEEEILYYESGEALDQIVQRSNAWPIPGSVQGQVGWGFAKPVPGKMSLSTAWPNNASSFSHSSQGLCSKLLTRLVAPLDALKHLNVLPKLRGPELDTVLKVWPDQGRVQGKNDLPAPAGHTIPDPGQDAIGLLGHLGTLLAHVQLLSPAPLGLFPLGKCPATPYPAYNTEEVCRFLLNHIPLMQNSYYAIHKGFTGVMSNLQFRDHPMMCAVAVRTTLFIGNCSSTFSTAVTETSFERTDTGMDWSFGSPAVPLTGVCIAMMPITESGITCFLSPGLE
ncbi:hypothetical protein DUI87_09294 [Hirundo rustica rustica]|uniref:Uncharacterized protein n=1 Tax=Hirundo rustica rustica TaxID=333673 RepID=A0A3M0KMD7_HIRRU|nr:hypothetical protein DUI87_09294 [Hirundo rustica rustica]